MALGLGCVKLQSLSLGNAKQITEGGLCEVAQYCRGLQTLNVGGCENITRNGLLALIEGLGYVEEVSERSERAFWKTSEYEPLLN